MTVTQFIFLLYREVLKFSVSPSEPMTGNSPRNAGDIGSILVWELGSHAPQSNYAGAPQLLSLCATTRVCAAAKDPACHSCPDSKRKEGRKGGKVKY